MFDSRTGDMTGRGVQMCPWCFSALLAAILWRRTSCFFARSLASDDLRPTTCTTCNRLIDNYECLPSDLTTAVQQRSISRKTLSFKRPLAGLSSSSEGVERSQVINGGIPALDADSLIDAAAEDDLGLIGVMEAAVDVLGGSTQWVVAGSVGATLVTRADAETLVLVLGLLLNAVFAKTLKKTINQVRPDGSRLKDPGMPSSHAMSLFFLGTYLVIGLHEHGVVNCPVPEWPLDTPQTQVLLSLYALTASLWRVKAGLHTLAQVSVGAVVGASDAVLWYWFCKVYFTSEVEEFFGGPDVPVEVAVGVCLATVLTFGNVQRQVSKLSRRSGDAKEL